MVNLSEFVVVLQSAKARWLTQRQYRHIMYSTGIMTINIYIYMNDIENKNICYSISVLSTTINDICRKSVEICIKNNL